MIDVNHMRRWQRPRKKRADVKTEISSFSIAIKTLQVDSEFDDMDGTEEMYVQRLKDRGSF